MMAIYIASGYCLISFDVSWLCNNLKYQATQLLRYCNLNLTRPALLYLNAVILLMILLCS